MMEFYSPTEFETPLQFPRHLKRKHQTFGMGPHSAQALARRLNLLNPDGPILVFGCAGALNPKHRPGDCFLIESVQVEENHFRMNIDRSLDFLPRASLLSLPQPLTTAQQKERAFKEKQADLVDCEMGFLLSHLSEPLCDRLIFVRGVSDRASESLDFLDGFELRWSQLVYPNKLFQFIRLLKNFFVYKKELTKFIDRLLLSSYLQESLDGESKTQA